MYHSATVFTNTVCVASVVSPSSPAMAAAISKLPHSSSMLAAPGAPNVKKTDQLEKTSRDQAGQVSVAASSTAPPVAATREEECSGSTAATAAAAEMGAAAFVAEAEVAAADDD